MSLQSSGWLTYPNPYILNDVASALDNYSATTYRLNSSGYLAANVFEVPKTGTIDKLYVRLRTVTTADDLTVGLQTVSSSLDPTGTLWSTGTSGTISAGSQVGQTGYEVTLGTGASVTLGQYAAIVVGFASTTGDIALGEQAAQVPGWEFPYCDLYTGSWSRNNSVFVAAPHYNDGTSPFCGMSPYYSSNANLTTIYSPTSTSSPNEYAMSMNIAFKCQVLGFWWMGSCASGANYTINLYTSGSQSTPVASATGNGYASRATGTAAGYILPVFLSTPYTLTPGNYFVSVLPSTSNAINVRAYQVLSSAYFGAFGGNTSDSLYSRSSTGASFAQMSATARPAMGLIISELDNGTGTGSRRPKLRTLGT